RDRFWAKGMEQDKINAYMTLYTCLKDIALASAPMIPFMTEEIYQNMVRSVDKTAPESIHLCDFPVVNEAFIDKKLEDDMDELLKIVVHGRACRNTANIKNRQPIGQMYIKAEHELDDMYVSIIEDELNVKKAIFTDDVSSFTSYSFKPQLRTVGPKYGKFLGGIQKALASLDGNAAYAELKANGVIKLPEVDASIELAEEDLLISMAQTEGFVADGDNYVTVVLDTNLTPELLEEGFVREIVSKIQTMRKEADFEVMDRITVSYESSAKIKDVFEANKDVIAGEVLADEIVCGVSGTHTKEWNINGEKVTLSVTRR
ncbi:MAG: class I tRNA ligase family protein, partial [Pseudobutyrivibrio sp.]|nr:class I tRNA ligase family protein [Pseudobutyrivibrio sp.]